MIPEIARVLAAHPDLVERIGIDALFGLSVWVVLACGQASLGNGGFSGLGAFACVLLVTRRHWAPAEAAAAAAGFAALAGLLLGLPMARLGRAGVAVVTLAFAAFVAGPAAAWLGFGGPHPWPGPARPIAPSTVYVVLAACSYAVWQFMRSKQGRAFAAVAQDERAAAGTGIDPARYKLGAFALGAALAGIAGALATLAAPWSAASNFGVDRSVAGLAFAVVGGTGSVGGPFIGALLLDVASTVLPRVAAWPNLVDAVALVVCVILLPRGAWSLVGAVSRMRAAFAATGAGQRP